MRRAVGGVVAGLVAGAVGVATAQLLAAVLDPQAGPLVAVGGTVIDATPTPVKEFAVRTFGTDDKPVLLTGISILLAAFAAVVGLVGTRHRRAGLAGAALFGLIGAAAALSRPQARIQDAVPALLGGVAAVAALSVLLRRIDDPAAVPPTEPTRRGFLRAAGLFAVGAAVAGAGGITLARLRADAAARLRGAVRLPRPASPAGPANTGTGFYTAARDFYRVDTALAVPAIAPARWRLVIHGMVEHPATLTLEQLLGRPAIERDITLNCVSNEVGGPYIGTARWLGIPLAPLLRETGIHAGTEQVVARSVDGMTIGTPIGTVLDGRDTMLAVGMNGQPLLPEHGFPVRMLTPGLYGYAGACKWVVDLELTTFAAYDPYWVRRGWARTAPVKTASRIDRPAPFTPLAAGPTTIAGVAWAQHRGITAVEVQVDAGPWSPARLLPRASADTWVQWTYPWHATPGDHQIRVRATDTTGATQPEPRHPTFPDGATGWHTISVTVT